MRLRTLPRAGQIHTAWLVFLGSVVLFALVAALLIWDPTRWFEKKEEPQPLVVYCAAGLQQPVEAIARDYEREYGVPVQLQYGGSETLLTNLQVSQQGDIYLPADTSYLDKARAKNLVDEQLDVGTMRPVIVVRKGNPEKIKTYQDLLRKDVRLAQANHKAAAIGQLTKKTLEKTGQWDELEKKTHVFKGTVNDVANDVKVGTVHTGIVWDITVRQYPELEAIEIPELSAVRSHIALGVLHSTKQPAAALRFARYLAARDRGLPVFEKHGYQVIAGDQWDANPELTIFSGTMFRPAIEDTLREFERREGVAKVNTIYAGCGILVADMGKGSRPDAFMACDRQFMDFPLRQDDPTKVRDLFIDETILSTNQLVILVREGNPHNIRSLRDLAKDGLQVGVGHDQQCALGLLTRQALESSKLWEAVSRNVVVTQPSGDLLITQMRTKNSLDAVVTYITNAVGFEAELDAIAIDGPCAKPTQPLAVGRETKYPHLTARLVKKLCSAESQKRFQDVGFQWQNP